jgi:hypothetical protein
MTGGFAPAARLVHVGFNWLDQMDLVASLREEEGVRSRAASHIEDCCRRRRSEALDQLNSASELEL